MKNGIKPLQETVLCKTRGIQKECCRKEREKKKMYGQFLRKLGERGQEKD